VQQCLLAVMPGLAATNRNNEHRRIPLAFIMAAVLCSGVAAQSLGDAARDERQRNKTTPTKTYSDDDSGKAPATQPSANVVSKPVGPSPGIPSKGQAGYQPLPSTAEIRQACRTELASRVEAAKRGNLDTAAEVCVLYEQPMDSAYEALVDRSVALQNELCPKIYPLGLDSPKVAADPVLGPKAHELNEIAKQFAQRMEANLKELTSLMIDKGQAVDSDPQYTRCKIRGLRMQADIARVAGNCGRGF